MNIVEEHDFYTWKCHFYAKVAMETNSVPRDYTYLEVYWTLITHTKFHVNWLNTFENRGGGGRPIDPLHAFV